MKYLLSRGIITAFAVTAALSAPVQAVEPLKSVTLKFSGEKKWAATCSLEKSNGKVKAFKKRGRGHRSNQVIASRQIAGGECAITVPEGTTLVVSFNSRPPGSCPFGEGVKTCAKRFSAGEQSFRFGA